MSIQNNIIFQVLKLNHINFYYEHLYISIRILISSRQTLANLFYFYVNDLFIKSFDFLVNFQDIFIFHPSKKKISNIWNWTIFEICCIQTLFACVYHHIYSHWVYKKVLNNVRSLLSIRQVILNMLTNNLRKC